MYIQYKRFPDFSSGARMSREAVAERSTAFFVPTHVEEVVEAGLGDSDAGIGGPVVHFDGSIRFQDPPAWEDHVGDVSRAFIDLLRSEDEVGTIPKDLLRIFEIEEHNADPVESSRGCFSDAVIENQPSFLGLERRGGNTYLVGSPARFRAQ